ncbi:MAG: hypothetical protein ILP24_05985, partial [Paludibacteraceae bacterium]|nr:hypothetical protein [Paludibacteraceae bacterium]
MKSIEVCHIALSANERYIPGALVAAAGVAVYASPETPLHFHLFTEEVKDESYEFFVKTLKRLHQKTEVTRHECDESILQGLPYWAGSRMAAVRCHYATLMPAVDWCLYLDCDVLYLASVEEHFAYRDENAYACVVQEESAKTRHDECEWIYENCGVNVQDEKYFNSGVILFNLRKMRQDGIPEKLMQFFQCHQDVPSPDQDALNAILCSSVRMIPQKFNRLQILISDAKLKEQAVVHYVHGNPWLPKYGTVANGRFKLWHAFADKYVWSENGRSVRRLFSSRMMFVKRLSWLLLQLPLVGWAYARSMQMLGKTSDGADWRFSQVGCD